MKILFVMCSLLLSVAMSSFAEGKFTIKDITSGVFSAKYVTGMRALPDGETYARISNDGKQIVSYYYKNGQQASILFDVNNTIGEHINSFDDYILSPDGSKMLIRTETEPVYRRSTRATYYVYNIATRRLTPLSSKGNIQNPIWSNDGNLVAYVRDNNIFLVKLLRFTANLFHQRNRNMVQIILVSLTQTDSLQRIEQIDHFHLRSEILQIPIVDLRIDFVQKHSCRCFRHLTQTPHSADVAKQIKLAVFNLLCRTLFLKNNTRVISICLLNDRILSKYLYQIRDQLSALLIIQIKDYRLNIIPLEEFPQEIPVRNIQRMTEYI